MPPKFPALYVYIITYVNRKYIVKTARPLIIAAFNGFKSKNKSAIYIHSNAFYGSCK